VISISELMEQVRQAGFSYSVQVDPLGTIFFGPPERTGSVSTAADTTDVASTNVIINGAAASTALTPATATNQAPLASPDLVATVLGQLMAGTIDLRHA